MKTSRTIWVCIIQTWRFRHRALLVAVLLGCKLNSLQKSINSLNFKQIGSNCLLSNRAVEMSSTRKSLIKRPLSRGCSRNSPQWGCDGIIQRILADDIQRHTFVGSILLVLRILKRIIWVDWFRWRKPIMEINYNQNFMWWRCRLNSLGKRLPIWYN